MTLAGQPTATQFFGIFFVTTLPAPFNFNKYFKTYNCCIFSNIHACTLKINFFNFFTYTIVVFPPLYC